MISQLSKSETERSVAEDPLATLVEELSMLVEQGENVEAFLEAHPRQASQLRGMLPAIRMLAKYGDGQEQRAMTSPGFAERLAQRTESDSLSQHTLGDFRIKREIGRGGMGVVYEAEQVSMHRTVALKVLPFAALANEKSLKRFQNEVRAAASLDHPHIVSVYSVGDDRGVHYYAMQLIRGQTWAAIIHQLMVEEEREKPRGTNILSEIVSSARDDAIASESDTHLRTNPSDDDSGLQSDLTARVEALQTTAGQLEISTARSGRDIGFYRSVAALGIQAAEALAHAHEQGVVHRDIKPGNLMLDANANVFVTDFGLARIESEAGVTMTGDVLGTLRYMSPEQALAKQIVDHRCDIYSLGATLYEMLVLRPAFPGEDRQSLLKQIATEEPRKLRQLNPTIPKDLETIVHKCLCKQRDERYESASALQADLNAFLSNRPIQAQPPTPSERLLKFASRHRGIITTAIVSTFLALSIATLFIFQSYRREAAQRLSAEEQSKRADINFQLALRTMDELYAVVRDDLLGVPGADAPGRTLLEKSIPFYRKFAHLNQANAELWPQVARAYLTEAKMRAYLGQSADAEKDFLRAIAMLEDIVAQFPEMADYRLRLATANLDIAEFYAEIDEAKKAEPYLYKVVDGLFDSTTSASYSGDYVEPMHSFGTTQSLLTTVRVGECKAAICLQLGHLTEAESGIPDNIELLNEFAAGQGPLALMGFGSEDHQSETVARDLGHHLAKNYYLLARVKYELNKNNEAKALLSESMKHRQSIIQTNPNRRFVRAGLRDHYLLLGEIHHREGALQVAAEAYRQAIQPAEWLVVNFPSAAKERLALTESLFRLGTLLKENDEEEQSHPYFVKCQTQLDLLDQQGVKLPGQSELRAALESHEVLSDSADDARTSDVNRTVDLDEQEQL